MIPPEPRAGSPVGGGAGLSGAAAPVSGQPDQPLPVISVVVAGYNDAGRLPIAVRSVLRQPVAGIEVLVCDDGSTDATPSVAAGLCAEDARVRFLPREQNSGSAAAPRNAGLRAARAPWVLFLDSDDELAPGALGILLDAALGSAADVVAGRISRLYVEEERWSGWCTRLYDRTRDRTSIDEEPELFYDTAAVGKLYRADFLRRAGLGFVRGLLYEDLLFTAQVYASAEHIVVVPDLVYIWKVEESAPRPSVTNDRASLDNLRGRLRANALIDTWLVDHGRSDLLAHKHVKFLRHDLPLSLGDLVSADDAWGATVMRELQGYVSGIPAEVVEGLPRLDRLGLHMLGRRDLEGVRSAYRALTREELATDLVTQDERVLWSGKRALAEPGDAGALDVTGLGIPGRPLLQLRLAHDLRAWTCVGEAVHVVIRTWNPLGRVPCAHARVWLELTPRSVVGFTEQFPGRITAVADSWFESTYVLDPRSLQRDPQDDRLGLAVVIQVSGLDNVGTIPHPAPDLVVPGGGWLVPVRSITGDLGVRHVPSGSVGPDDGASDHRRPGSAGSRARGSAERLADAARKRVRRRLGPPLAVFCSEGGRAYSGNPKYLHEELVRVGWDGDIVWVRGRGGRGFPEGVPTVTKGSRQYYLAMGSATHWVDDTGVPAHVDKPRGTRYLHAQDRLQRARQHLRARARGDDGMPELTAQRWDMALGHPGDRAAAAPAPGRTRVLADLGIPRLDPLIRTAGVAAARRAARGGIGLPADLGGLDVLLAPLAGLPPGAAGLPWPPAEAASLVSGRGRLLFAAPPADRWRVPAELSEVLVDVGRVPDWTLALLASDVLVTCDPALWCEYLLLDRPVIVYRHEGCDAPDGGPAPGPVASSGAEVAELLDGLPGWAGDYAEARHELRARLLPEEDGRASSRVVAAVFGVRG